MMDVVLGGEIGGGMVMRKMKVVKKMVEMVELGY